MSCSSKNQAEQNADDGIDDDDDDVLAPKVRSLLGEKKYPLRIDLRNNDPERTAIEKMLQNNEYKSGISLRRDIVDFNNIRCSWVRRRERSATATAIVSTATRRQRADEV